MDKRIFSKSNFLVICILFTAASICSLVNSVVDIFAILNAIALWIIYSSSKSENKLEGVKFLGGITKALFIVKWVAVGILTCTGISIMLIPTAWLNKVWYYSNINFYMPYSSIIQKATNVAVVWIGLFFLIVATIIAVINILFTRKLYKLIYDVDYCYNVETRELNNIKSISVWLLVLGILTSIGVLSIFSNSYSALYSGCLGAAMIMSSIFIKNELLGVPVTKDQSYPKNDWYSDN